MKHIGFTGGSSIRQIGTVADMVLFFDCLNLFVVSENPRENWKLITERLYKKYVRLEELVETCALMERARTMFEKIPSSSVNRVSRDSFDSELYNIDFSVPILSDLFAKYFIGFFYCAESSSINYEEFNGNKAYRYEPVMTVITDLPDYMIACQRSLEEYDLLRFEDPPFWLR
ncbi:hypothetical protein [Agrobacterium tumefaciens]|uniref:hypothetical protein n=1 Tax=Agrobacterium tumefaciens TaxID=358 RepID=UPI001FA98628|nr:hypothetical protein [Agrobacterium tumefaciens]UNZ53285.1 hypothetical protein MLE07_21275 [Agrobacterium tumefaciens]